MCWRIATHLSAAPTKWRCRVVLVLVHVLAANRTVNSQKIIAGT